MLQEFLALCHGLPDTDCAALLCEVRGVSSRQQLSHADLTLEEVVIALSIVSHRMHPGTGGFDAAARYHPPIFFFRACAVHGTLQTCSLGTHCAVCMPIPALTW